VVDVWGQKEDWDAPSKVVIEIGHELFALLKRERKAFLNHTANTKELYEYSFWDSTPDFYCDLNDEGGLGGSVQKITEKQMARLIANHDKARMTGCTLCIRYTGFGWRASEKHVAETIETEEISWKTIGL